MLSRRLRRTMARKAATQRFATLTGPPIMLATVTAVEVGDGTPGTAYATVELNDGTTTTLPDVGGYLPGLGATVPLLMNGADPVSLLQGIMVDGNMQSRDFVEGVWGWRITADGDVEFNTATIRGDVIAASFRTAADFTVSGGVEITTTEGLSTIVMRRPGALEDYPARIAALTNRLRIEGTDDRARVVLEENGLASLEGNNVLLEALAGDVRFNTPGHVTINDVSLNQPPMRELTGTRTVVNTSTQLIDFDATVQHHTLLGGADSVTINAANGIATPKVAGMWQVSGRGYFPLANHYYQAGVNINGAPAWLDQSEGNTLGHANVNGWSYSQPFRFNGTTDTVQPIVYQASGGSVVATLSSFHLLWLHE